MKLIKIWSKNIACENTFFDYSDMSSIITTSWYLTNISIVNSDLQQLNLRSEQSQWFVFSWDFNIDKSRCI